MKRIIVTDSGLGGINVMANAFNQLKRIKTYPEVELIFFNALPDEQFGYNQLESLSEKVRIFATVLKSIDENYHPDNILIACNTLSVVYNSIDLNLRERLPVTGILETGVKMIFDKLKNDTDSHVIIIGTPTTINSRQHETELINKGVEPSRIISVPCLLLESVIQNNPDSPDVFLKIEECLYTTIKDLERQKKIYLALCCTHYEYSSHSFEKFLHSNRFVYEVLNPNEKMLESLIFNDNKNEKEPKIVMKVVSKTKIKESDINSINRILRIKCPELQEVLANYEYKPDLFKL